MKMMTDEHDKVSKKGSKYCRESETDVWYFMIREFGNSCSSQ